VFCSGSRRRATRTAFGVVHEVPAPLPVALHGPPVARAVVRFAHRLPGPVGIHSFAVWAPAGVLAARALTRRGVTAIPVASAYATRAYEVGAMQDGLHAHLRRGQRVRYRAWLRWIRAVDDRIEGWGYAQSRLVLVNYASVARILQRSYGLGATVRQVPYASTAAFAGPPRVTAPGPGDARPPVVVSVSRHDPRKGVDVLLRALALVAADGVAFQARLVGPGRLLEAHRRLAAELGLGDRVALPGRVEDVASVFADADVFVLPSLAEASGSVSVHEALRAGTPVIASACDGIPEDLTDGVDALLVPAGDAAALAAALRRLLTEPRLRAALTDGGRHTHEQRFSAGRFVDGLRGVYGELGIV
jgi:glycosyltransferase involved in cell wall biosynthesis